MREPDGAPLDIVMLGDGALESRVAYTPQRVAAGLARRRRVLYVDPPYAARTFLKRPGMLMNGSLRAVRDGLFLLKPPVPLPNRFQHHGMFRAMARGIERHWLRRALRELGMDRFAVWVYSPYDAPLVAKLGARLVAFEYKDEISSFPTYRAPRRKLAVQRLERTLLQRADVVFAPTEVLAERKRALHPRVHVVPFAVDRDHFATARLAATEIPQDVGALPRPRVGYIGALDRYKVDFDLLTEVAGARPRYCFVLVGPIGVTDPTRASHLPRGENLVFLGERSYDLLPGYLKAFDVCIVPHCLNRYAQTNFPFKILEYLAAGRPIVATDLPALRGMGSAVRIAGSAAEFAARIDECLLAPPVNGQRPPDSCWSWEERTDRMLEILEGVEGLAGRARAGA